MFNFKDVYINDWFSVIGPLEKENLKKYDFVINDYYYNEKTFENAEVKMQKEVISNLGHLHNIDLIVGADLSNQLSVSAYANRSNNIPFLGLYSACSSFCLGIINICTFLENKKIKEGLFVTSSHNLVAEKQFRFPIEYGAPKPIRSTFTATGAIGVVLSKTPSNIKVVNGTIGAVNDSFIKDANHMGAVMAISAYDTLKKHLRLTKTTVNDYDLILSGDLGRAGEKILKDCLKKDNIILKNYIDAGTLLYSNDEYSGASGPATLPLVFFNNIIYNKKYKKILLLATGSLHNTTFVNQKNTIPSITHALTIEVIK